MAQNDIDPNEHPVRANRGIVIVVATLGVLIVLGLGGLVYGIAMKAGKLGSSDNRDVGVAAPAEPAMSSPSAPSMEMSSDRRVLSMTADGGRLYLLIRAEDGGERVRAYDSTGTLLYEVNPAAQ